MADQSGWTINEQCAAMVGVHMSKVFASGMLYNNIKCLRRLVGCVVCEQPGTGLLDARSRRGFLVIV